MIAVRIHRTVPRGFALLGTVLCITLSAHAATTFNFARQTPPQGLYTPGQTLDITVEVNLVTDGEITGVGVEETLPEGWTYVELVSGDLPNIEPFPGKEGLLEFSWFPIPEAFPLQFTYRVAVPEEDRATRTITGNGVGRVLPGGAIVTSSVNTPLQPNVSPLPDVRRLLQEDAEDLLTGAGFVIGDVTVEYSVPIAVDRVKRTDPEPGTPLVPGSTIDLVVSLGAGQIHSGDTEADGVITLSEVLRVIQVFSTGSYSCDGDPPTEDGFQPGEDGDQSCNPHDADADDNRRINLSELLRFIQLYNTRGYHYCPGAVPATEDGYCLGI